MDAAHFVDGVWHKLPIWCGLPKGVFNKPIHGEVDAESIIANVAYRLEHMPQLHSEAALDNIGFYNEIRKKFIEPLEFDPETHQLDNGQVDQDGRVFWAVIENAE